MRTVARIARGALNIVVFVAALVLGCAAVGHFLPPMRVPIVTPKLEWYTAHADEYDCLYIGSSRTFRQILPSQFDAEMAAGGQPFHSFNLGVDGMRPPEDTYLLERALAVRTKPLKLVLVECNPLRLKERPEDHDTERAVYWHDNRRLATLYRSAFQTDTKKRSWRKRLAKNADMWPAFADHLHYWLWRNSNLGRGHELLADWTGLRPFKPFGLSDVGPAKDGFKPAMDLEHMPPKQTAAYRQELAEHGRMQPEFGDWVSEAEIRYKQKLIEQAGGRIVLVVPPFLGERIYHVPEKKGLPPVLDFSEPEKYPDLFVPEHRADAGHTNTAGSKILTHLIVTQLLPILNAASPAPAVAPTH